MGQSGDKHMLFIIWFVVLKVTVAEKGNILSRFAATLGNLQKAVNVVCLHYLLHLNVNCAACADLKAFFFFCLAQFIICVALWAANVYTRKVARKRSGCDTQVCWESGCNRLTPGFLCWWSPLHTGAQLSLFPYCQPYFWHECGIVKLLYPTPKVKVWAPFNIFQLNCVQILLMLVFFPYF